MLRLLPARLRQLLVVVGDVEPLHLPLLVGVDELVRQVLLGGVPRIWMPTPSTTLGLLALGCGFKQKNFRNKTQWGLIPMKASQKWMRTET
jgi:hypothetical protein